jgi:hypothetical protein
MKRIAVTAMLLTILSSAAWAEVYNGMGPFKTLAEIQQMFPRANFTRMFPAWAQPDDIMYMVGGLGITGTMVLKFSDYRPIYKQRAEAAINDNNAIMAEHYEKEANGPDNSVVIQWVRWVPDSPVPIERLIAKYGKPEKTDFNSDDFKPFKAWPTRGITAYTSDDGKRVQKIDFGFTDKDYRAALNLQDPAPTKEKVAVKKKPKAKKK